MTRVVIRALVLSSLLATVSFESLGFLAPTNPPPPDIDKRNKQAAQPETLPAAQAAALATLRAQVPGLSVDFEPVTVSPKVIGTTEGFLTGANGAGKTLSANTLAGLATDATVQR